MSKTACCAVLVLATSSIARADTTTDDASKSELVATTLSVGGTLAGAALLTGAIAGADFASPYHAAFPELLAGGIAGLALGPSIGRWYAHDHATKGLVLRSIGLGGVAAGFAMYQTGIVGAIFGGNPGMLAGGLVVGAASIGLVVAGTAIDIWGAHDSVRRFNRTLAVAPMITPHGGNGLAVVGTF